MEIKAVKEKILTDEKFVISEIKKIQTLYKLKGVIRYNQARRIESHTESVAEHIYAMHILVDYFLPLEDEKGRWNKLKIHQMVQYHDLDEIETGDIVGYRKTNQQQAVEYEMSQKVTAKLSCVLQAEIQKIIAEYHHQQTIEARFAKAIDKIEPVFHLYNENGKIIMAELKTTKEQHDSVKIPYVKDFPVLKRFAEVSTDIFEKEGFYHPSSC